MRINTLINRKISSYSPNGRLAHMARYYLARYEIKQPGTKEHCQRVALLAEKVAFKLKEDAKDAFLGALLHDVGKLDLRFNPELFDGHNINQKEYELIKQHALIGFKMLKNLHYSIALCAGLHHALRKSGYGIDISEFPKNWGKEAKEKLIRISTIISICDYIDGNDRQTTVKHGLSSNKTLEERLKEDYPNQGLIIETALQLSQRKKRKKI